MLLDVSFHSVLMCIRTCVMCAGFAVRAGNDSIIINKVRSPDLLAADRGTFSCTNHRADAAIVPNKARVWKGGGGGGGVREEEERRCNCQTIPRQWNTYECKLNGVPSPSEALAFRLDRFYSWF